MGNDAGNVPTLIIKRIIDSSPEKIFELWTNPHWMVHWMSPYPGVVCCEVSADVRIGGAFRLVMRSPDSECEIEGTYVDVQPPHRLVFTWAGPPTAGANTLVTLVLKPVRGGTELTLTHERLPTHEVRQGHRVGWSAFMDHLVDAIRGAQGEGFPG